jgi:hypothetical protein
MSSTILTASPKAIRDTETLRRDFEEITRNLMPDVIAAIKSNESLPQHLASDIKVILAREKWLELEHAGRTHFPWMTIGAVALAGIGTLIAWAFKS